jgi:hypothetical protein
MSENDEAMIEHMSSIVHVEKRSFSFKDFLSFKVNDKLYTLQHGTIRNKFSKLLQKGEIEIVYNSGIAFYTLKGVPVGKKITPNGIGISSDHPYYRLIQDLVLDKYAIHNIHLNFKVNYIWSIFSNNSSFKMNYQSKDIKLAEWIFDNDTFVSVTVHKTDTVTVIIRCSYRPFTLDMLGIIDFTNILAKIEDRISQLIFANSDHKMKDSIQKLKVQALSSSCPSYKNWIVSMWHFGADSRVTYSGKTFSIKWEIAENIINQIYSKEFRNGKSRRIRLERQEYPHKKILEAIEQKLDPNNATLN